MMKKELMEKELMDSITLKKLHNVMLEITDEIVRICNKYNLTYFLVGGSLLGAVRHNGFIPWDDDMDIGMPRKDYEIFLEKCKTELSDKYLVDNMYTNKKYYLNFTKIRKKNTIFEQDFQINYNGNKGIWVDVFPYDDAKTDDYKDIKWRGKKIKFIFSLLHYKNGFFLSKKKLVIKKMLGIIAKLIPNTVLLRYQNKLMIEDNNENSKYIVALATTYSLDKELLPKEEYLPTRKLKFEDREYAVPNNYKYILERIYGNFMELPPKEKQITHNPIKLEFDVELNKNNIK